MGTVNGDSGKKSVCFLAKITMRREKEMYYKNKKDTRHYCEQNGHEKQTAKQILCTIIDQKGERLRLRKQIFFNTDTYGARRHFNVLYFL